MYCGPPFGRIAGDGQPIIRTAFVTSSPGGRPLVANTRLSQGFDKWFVDHMLTSTMTKLVPSTWPRHAVDRGGFGRLPAGHPFPGHVRGAGDVGNFSVNQSYPSSGMEVPMSCPMNAMLTQSNVPVVSHKTRPMPLMAAREDFQEDEIPNPSIKDVWKGNLDREFAHIRSLLTTYKFVAMDTEFPGVVICNAPCFRNLEGSQLETIRKNVDALKLIQLGISFFDENGQSPPGTSTWQFNFKFNIKEDRCAQKSIHLLQEAGMQFERHIEEGIDPEDFCYLFFTSGLVLKEDISWLTYHGGYDFGYLMRILRGQNLPTDPEEFCDFMQTYFPTCYDIKVLLAADPSFVGGLHEVANRLGLQRIGSPHQAGSDSLLTGKVFFRIKQKFLDNSVGDSVLEKYNGKIYGFGNLDDCILGLASCKNLDLDVFGLDFPEECVIAPSVIGNSCDFPVRLDESEEPKVSKYE